jgi:hypothetical protein
MCTGTARGRYRHHLPATKRARGLGSRPPESSKFSGRSSRGATGPATPLPSQLTHHACMPSAPSVVQLKVRETLPQDSSSRQGCSTRACMACCSTSSVLVRHKLQGKSSGSCKKCPGSARSCQCAKMIWRAAELQEAKCRVEDEENGNKSEIWQCECIKVTHGQDQGSRVHFQLKKSRTQGDPAHRWRKPQPSWLPNKYPAAGLGCRTHEGPLHQQHPPPKQHCGSNGHGCLPARGR